MSPYLSTASDVQRVIELLIHLRGDTAVSGSHQPPPHSELSRPWILSSLPPKDPPCNQSPRKLQLPKNPGAVTRAPRGESPRELPGGVVPRLGTVGRRTTAAASCVLPWQLTSRMAEQKRLCRTRWRACSFCGGSSPLRWSRSRSSTARDTSAGGGGGAGAETHGESETPRLGATERCSERKSKGELRLRREGQPKPSRTSRRVEGGE